MKKLALRAPATLADRALVRALEAHLDPRGGSPYWLGRAAADPALRRLERVADLPALGPFDRRLLEERPLEHFVPRSLLEARRPELILSESGGTSGRPVRTVYTPAELHEGFGEPFWRASRARGFPTGGRWLFVGPSGPHVIGQAARLLARLHGALEPFSVDLDPRWARAQEGLPAALYREHVLAQALDVVRREAPDVLFVTPPLLDALAPALGPAERTAVRGIHLGGLPVPRGALARYRRDFPAAVLLPGYGNSLAGLLSQVLEPGPEGHLDYYPLEGRLVVEVCAEAEGAVDVTRPLPAGERGRVVLHRLDRSALLPNLVERDVAVALDAPPAVRRLGYAARGVRDPGPAPTVRTGQGEGGLY